MIKFATFIEWAGLDPNNFRNLAKKELILFDENDYRIYFAKSIHFPKKLFANNPDSLMRLQRFLYNIDSSFKEDDINVMISSESVILFYKTPKPTIFFR